jgi:hypothetical protein
MSCGWIATALLLTWLSPAVPLVRGAEATVPLGRAGNFSVLAGSMVTNSGATAIAGNVGVWPGTNILGFPPGTISAARHAGNVAAFDAQVDLAIAIDDARARPTTNFLVGDIGGQTLVPGVYQSSSTLDITSGNLTLDARNNSNAVFIFQIAWTFAVAPSNRVVLARGARAGRIFWQVGISATLGAGSQVKGNILAVQSITFQPGAVLEGKALTQGGEVTLESNSVRGAFGGPGPAPPGVMAVDVLTPVTLNPQTGLLEQTIRLRNVGTNAVAAGRVVMQSFRAGVGVTVYNASGILGNGRPFLQYNRPIPVDGGIEFVIEYFRSNRQPFISTNFLGQATSELAPLIVVGPRGAVTRQLLGLGRMLVQFRAQPGARYAIEYSDDQIIWKTARPVITAPANRVFWIDNGPPKTESSPPSYRAYRFVRL